MYKIVLYHHPTHFIFITVRIYWMTAQRSVYLYNPLLPSFGSEVGYRDMRIEARSAAQ